MNFIERIKEKNQFPILFIGSGIIQRYFKNAPTWEELLIELWSNVYERNKYFLRAKDLKDSGHDKFQSCLLIADELEKAIDNAFYDEKLIVHGLEIEQAYPIKKYLSAINQMCSTKEEKRRFDERKLKSSLFWQDINRLPVSKKDVPLFKDARTAMNIYSLKQAKEASRINYLVKNMRDFSLNEITALIEMILSRNSDNIISKTEYRRLFMAYSLLL